MCVLESCFQLERVEIKCVAWFAGLSLVVVVVCQWSQSQVRVVAAGSDKGLKGYESFPGQKKRVGNRR